MFTTARKSANNNIFFLRLDLTIQKLRNVGVKFDSIVGDLSSPRVVVNDDGAFAVDHEINSPFHYHPEAELFESN